MKPTRTRNSLAIAALWVAALSTSPARAQSTAFTYQGSLDDGGVPANGLHDFRFTLFNMAAPAGVVIAPPNCVDDVDVVDGVFTVELDFGQQYATTGERHLHIDVRQDTGLPCTDASGFVALAPRHQITATPMASHANSAFALDAADGSPASAVFVDNSGNVGIGTVLPTARLDVRGGPMLVENLGDQADLLWLASERSWVFRQEGTGAGAALKLESIGGGGNKHFIVQTTGFMGIGTTVPNAKLDVRGDIVLGPTGVLQAMSGEERVRVLRGQVNSLGAVIEGTGFTVVRTAAGSYTINFTTPFPVGEAPAVTVSGEYYNDNIAHIAMTNFVTTSATGIRITTGGGTLADAGFRFIAIGPR